MKPFNLTNEMVNERMGGVLEEKLRRTKDFRAAMKNLSNVLKKWEKGMKMTPEQSELYRQVEKAVTDYNIMYGQAAYRQGVEDGINVGREQSLDGQKTIFSLHDMIHMVAIYDAVKQLNVTLLGDNLHDRNGGVLKDFDLVYDVIHSGLGYSLALLGEDTAEEKMIEILENLDIPPEECAKQLIGTE